MATEKSILDLIQSIDNGEYTIPEFQRGFVWNSTQVKEFFRSLYLGYPTGSFLIWKTKDPSEIKGGKKDTNSVYHQLILDGQQRLTTIYSIFKRQTPEWYEGVSLRTDLYFNLKSEEFEYYMQKKMSNKLEWINVADFLSNGGVNKFIEKLSQLNESDREFYLQNLQTLNKLDSIKNYGYYIKEITISEIEKVVEIFNLVNKSGTTLNESDLALAIITSNWPDVKKKFRSAIKEYKEYNYEFSFRFFTRCLNIMTTGRGKFSSEISNVTPEQFEEAWEKLHKILPHIINVLRGSAYIDSSDSYNSFYVLYILIYYLSKNDLKFKNQEEANKAIFWLFTSLLWGRFSGSSESYLEKDINALKEKNSLDALIEEMHLFRGDNLYLREEDLALQGVRSRIYNIFYSAIRAQNARDWANPALTLYSKSVGKNNKLQRHHIFPKAFLYRKYNSSNSIHKAMVNEISNIAFITQQSNIEILDKDPAEYLNKIDPQELRKQFVPTDKTLYDIENYEEFLKQRRRLLSEGINNFLKSYFSVSGENQIPQDLTWYNDEIERIEIALRELINEKLTKAADENAYKEFIPSHIREKVDYRLNSWVKKNPGEDVNQYSGIRQKLDFFDLQEYKDLIVRKDIWNLFEENFGNKNILTQRFNQLSELRNSIRHSRKLTQAMIKDGEASIYWFDSALRNYIKEQEVESLTE